MRTTPRQKRQLLKAKSQAVNELTFVWPAPAVKDVRWSKLIPFHLISDGWKHGAETWTIKNRYKAPSKKRTFEVVTAELKLAKEAWQWEQWCQIH